MPLLKSIHFSLARLAAVFAALLLTAAAAPAQTWFVVPSAEIPIRRGMGTEYRIITVAPDGTEVELVDEEEGWAFVRLKDGKEGWMPKRFLKETPPPYQQVARLEEEKAGLVETNLALQTELDELTEINAQAAGELATCIAERDGTDAKYQSLQQDAAEALQTKEKLTLAEQQLQQLQSTLATIQAENASLKKSQAMRWFLAGGSVLLAGWLLGVLTGKSKKRRSSLL